MDRLKSILLGIFMFLTGALAWLWHRGRLESAERLADHRRTIAELEQTRRDIAAAREQLAEKRKLVDDDRELAAEERRLIDRDQQLLTELRRRISARNSD